MARWEEAPVVSEPKWAQAPEVEVNEEEKTSFKPTARSNVTGTRALSSAASGFNKGMLANVPGFAMDTVLNVADLLKAGAGYTYSKATGNAPPEALDPYDRRNIVMSSAWLRDLLGRNTVTERAINQNAEEFPALHAGGQATASALAMRGPQSLAGGGKEVARTAAIAFPAAAAGQKVAEKSGIPEAAIFTELGLAPLLANASRLADLRPRILFDDAAALARENLRPYTKDQINQAIQRQRFAVSQGQEISPSQAFGGSKTLGDLENFVLDSYWSSKPTVEKVGKQPAQAREFTEKTVRSLGATDYSTARANRIEAAAEAGLKMPRDTARALAQPYYNFLQRTRPQLPESVRWELAGRLQAVNEQVGLLEQSYAAQAVTDTARRATTDSMIVQPTKGNPPFRRGEGGIYELDNYLKELQTRINRLDSINADSKQAVERAGLKPAASSIRSLLLENSDVLAKAKDIYQTTRTKLGEIVRSTGIRDMAASPDAEGPMKPPARWETLESVIKRDQSPQDLVRANQILSRSDPNAVATLTRNVVNDAVKSVYGDTKLDQPTAATQVAQKIRSTPNIETAVEITMKRNGASNPKQAATGFMKLLDVIELSGLPRGQPGGGGLISKTEQTSGSRFLAVMGFGNELAKSSAILRRAQQLIDFRTVKQLEKAVFDTDGVAKLQRLSSMDPFSVKATELALEILKPKDVSKAQMPTLGVMYPTIQQIINQSTSED